MRNPTVLHHLYINPLEKCNLACKICYTKKTSPILSQEQILAFIARYESVQQLQTVTFCGGEVFALPYMPELINILVEKGVFVSVITNGTIDRLDQIHTPNSVNMIVSIDGLECYHDANRGRGNFQKSLMYIDKAQKLGFHTEVFSIVTRQNISQIDAFESYLSKNLPKQIDVTYHPRKPPAYLQHHPVSNIEGQVEGFDFLEPHEMIAIMQTKTVFPPKNLGCYQVAVMSDGKVYGCCEGITPIGTIDDPPQALIDALRARLAEWETVENHHANSGAGNLLATHCLGCSQPAFMCGIRKYLLEIQKIS